VLQALMVPAIGIFAGLIAYMQWRTAHQKVMLDLFDKRLRVYNLVGEAVRSVITSGEMKRSASATLGEAMEVATFLYGNDIHDYIEKLWRTFSRLNTLNRALEQNAGQQAADERMEAFKTINDFYVEAPQLFGRYLRMDQRIPRSFREVFSDRNALRWSYADEKQKS
jgi:hypothetical protein